jgi:hypothetical protein
VKMFRTGGTLQIAWLKALSARMEAFLRKMPQ